MTHKYVPIEGSSGLVRDMKSRAIINNDKSAYETAKKARQIRLENQEKIKRLEQDVSEMKLMLVQILGKLDNK